MELLGYYIGCPLVICFLLFHQLNLAITFGFTGWMFCKNPLLINPYVVFERLKTDNISIQTLKLMAIMLPTTMLMCLGLMVLIILMTFEILHREKMYLMIIQRFAGEK